MLAKRGIYKQLRYLASPYVIKQLCGDFVDHSSKLLFSAFHTLCLIGSVVVYILLQLTVHNSTSVWDI